MMFEFLDKRLFDLAASLGVSTFEMNPVIAVVLVGLSCGLVGSLVVSNRMAFFSDAMAHTAFAGVAFALLFILLAMDVHSTKGADKYLVWVPPIMAAIGVVVGVSIAFVREKTGLTNDTVIGVFFALSMGIGAMLLPAIRVRYNIDADQLLFGSITLANGQDLFTLAVLALITLTVVSFQYNSILFSSFNPSLARSRGIAVRANNYAFIVLLALVVNLSIKAVGVLLINALLVVPAAAAANIANNNRQVFWFTLLGSVGCGVAGQQISQHVQIPIRDDWSMDLGPGGTIIIVCVAWFFLTMTISAFLGRGRGSSGDRTG